MAWSASKIFSACIRDSLNSTASFNLDADTLKANLWDNSITPDQTVTSANSANGAGVWAAGSLSNGGWSSGGLALGSVTSTFTSNVYTLDAADTPVSAGAITDLTERDHVGTVQDMAARYRADTPAPT